MKLYLAAPLFSQHERQWNRTLAAALAEGLPGWEIVLPQDLRVGGSYNDRARFGELFQRTIGDLASTDLLVAVVDGPDCDSGVAFEVGFAYAKGIPVVAVRTDFRQSQEKGVNVLLARAAEEYLSFMSFEEDTAELARAIAGKVKKVAAGITGKAADVTRPPGQAERQ